MSARAVPLDRRRAELLRRSAELRTELEACAAVLGDRLHAVDEGTRFFRRHAAKLLLASATLLLALRGPRRLLQLAGPLAVAWPIVRRWLPTLTSLAPWRRSGSAD
jgi:hypothetical protein